MNDDTTVVRQATIIQLPVRRAPVPKRPSALHEFKQGLAPFFRGFWIIAFWSAVINVSLSAFGLPEVGFAAALVYQVIAIALNLV